MGGRTWGVVGMALLACAGCTSVSQDRDAAAPVEVWDPGPRHDVLLLDVGPGGRPDTGPTPDADLDAPFPDANEDAPSYDAPCTLECPHLPLGCAWVRTDFTACMCGDAVCVDSGPGPDAALRGTDAYVEGDVGGIYCVANGDCPSGQFCGERPDGCGGAGACRGVPTSCPDVEGIVCGCDGLEYGSACEAALVQVSVAASGPCITPRP